MKVIQNGGAEKKGRGGNITESESEEEKLEHKINVVGQITPAVPTAAAPSIPVSGTTNNTTVVQIRAASLLLVLPVAPIPTTAAAAHNSSTSSTSSLQSSPSILLNSSSSSSSNGGSSSSSSNIYSNSSISAAANIVKQASLDLTKVNGAPAPKELRKPGFDRIGAACFGYCPLWRFRN